MEKLCVDSDVTIFRYPSNTLLGEIMDIANVLSGLAVLISIGGLIYAKKSFSLSQSTQAQTNEMEIDIEKNELLKLISNNKKLLNKSSIELGVLKADFEAETQPVRMIMREQALIFTRTLPIINYSLDNLEKLRLKIQNWNGTLSHKDVMRYKSELYEQMKDHELNEEITTSQIKTFKEKLLQAREYANGATR